MNTTFIKIPNSIIGELKGNNCLVYLYIIYLCTVKKTACVKVKQDTVAQRLGIGGQATVSRTMHRLQNQGYVKLQNNCGKHVKNTCCTITLLNFDPQSDYFLLPAEYIFLGMPCCAVELMLTLYMFSFADSYCFPSYTEISKISKLSFTSIAKGCAILEENGIIKKENYFKKDGSKGHNRYFIIKKTERLIGADKAEKLMAWIKKQKGIFFFVWQIIKEVLRGNAAVLGEICAQIEETFCFEERLAAVECACSAPIFVPNDRFFIEYEKTPVSFNPIFEDCKEPSSDYRLNEKLEIEISDKNHSTERNPSNIFAFLKRKISQIRSGISRFFSSAVQKVKIEKIRNS